MALTGHGHTGRQRLRPWLIDQINSGSYPGLRWIDQEQMIFQISWKHFGKPGVNEERDAKIFREWARHTGKFKSGDPPDPSTWKTRFRCALYKLQDIEEMSSMNMLDGEEPYRVYRFKSKGMDYIISTWVMTLISCVPAVPWAFLKAGREYIWFARAGETSLKVFHREKPMKTAILFSMLSLRPKRKCLINIGLRISVETFKLKGILN